MAERSVDDLLARIARAQRNLGPRNPYRTLLSECAACILSIAEQYRQAQRPTVTITRDPEAEGVVNG